MIGSLLGSVLRPAVGAVGAVAEHANLARRVAGSVPVAMLGRSTADSLLDRLARERPDTVAIAQDDQRISFGEARRRADQYARFFRDQGVEPGDRVAVDLANRPDLLFVFHGLQRLGATAALINTNLDGAPLAHVVATAEPSLVVVGAERAHTLAGLLGALPDLPARDVWVVGDGDTPDPAALPEGVRLLDDEVSRQATDPVAPTAVAASGHCAYISTSGTTGLPKAAVISHQRFVTTGAMAGHVMHRVEAGEMIYVALPLYHSSALFLGWSAALATGAGIALRRKFSASAFFADVRRYDAVSAIYIGELCRYLLHSPEQPDEREHRLRVLVGNGLRPDVWEPFQERFAVPLIREFYGATEGTGVLVNLSGKPGMVGRLTPGTAIVRCDPVTGEPVRNAAGRCERVSVGEAGLFLGPISRAVPYDGYRDDAATSNKVLRHVFRHGDRWFDSGDLLRLHPHRWVSFVDRMGDTFRWKGENVSTNEVADIVNRAAGVVEANVFGVRVADADGRAGMAELVVTDDFDLDAFAAHVVASMPSYERPLFLRLRTDGVEVTGTFKHRKVDARDAGFDPSLADDPLHYLAGDRYLPIDAGVHAAIEAGDLVPG